MKNITKHTGTITELTRLACSYYGNPRYKARIVEDDGYTGITFVTAVDSMHGYALPNYEGKRVTVTLGEHYNRLTLNTIEA